MSRITAKAAPYNQTSISEQQSADIFHHLLNRKFIKGNANVMDKVPNSDGFMTIVQHDQIPIGHFDIQLKTLKQRDIKKPKFQCELTLLAYSQDSILPVILVVVDQQNKKAYWLHLDNSLISSIAPQVRGKSISILLIPDNCVDGNDEKYVDDWKKIVKTVRKRVQNYDVVEQQRSALSAQLGEFGTRLLPAFSLNQFAIREIHVFLDFLNNLFDHEFKAIKDILYYNYWKIGVGIVEYQTNKLRYFLIPQALSSNSPLIKELVKSEEGVVEDLFMKDGAIALIWNGENNSIKDNPKKSALKLVCKDVFKIVGKVNFAIEHQFIAKEYLSGFINTFHSFLGLEENTKTIKIERLRLLLFVVLPTSLEMRMNFADGVKDLTYSIDSHKGSRYARNNLNHIENAERELFNGYIPYVNVTLTSSLFDFNLIKYYLDMLSSVQVEEIPQVYLPMRNNNVHENFIWKSWIKENVYQNLTVFYNEFIGVYNQLVRDKFPFLSNELDFFGENDLIIYVIHFDDSKKPHLEYFQLKTQKLVDKSLLFYIANDTECQFSMRQVYDSGIKTFVVQDVVYDLQLMGTHNIHFLFELTPTYALINEILGEM